MNRFFISKVNQLRQSIPNSDSDPLKILRETMSSRSCSFSLEHVHPDEMMNIIKNLKSSKSSGLDFLDTYVIKLAAEHILPAITHIVNLSISEASFPKAWKAAKVAPLLKKADHLNPKNYRPVALLPVLSKILEREVFSQLVQYLDNNALLHPNHHGSRRGHSTATALIQMYDTWVKTVDEGNMAGVMMVDLSAAFDMVDCDILVAKLEFLRLELKAIYRGDHSVSVLMVVFPPSWIFSVEFLRVLSLALFCTFYLPMTCLMLFTLSMRSYLMNNQTCSVPLVEVL